MKKLNIVSWGFTLLLAVFVLSGCGKEGGAVKPKDEGNLIVTIPKSGLFGITGDNEKAIAEIAILVFNTDGELYRRPIYIKGEDGTEVGDDIVFDIKLQPRAYGDIMILANSEAVCRSAVDTTEVGLPRDQILTLLKFEHPGRWNATAPNDYTPIPMWGSTGAIVMTKDKIFRMKMVRMLAGVDLYIPDQLVADDLKIEEIFVYNTNKTGQIIPSRANWDEDNLVVVNPTIPTGSTINSALGYTEIKDKKSCIGEIYIFEASNTPLSSPLKAACLVIKARYKTDVADTYYAIHLEKKNNSGVVISEDILRNHKYIVKIVGVLGSGEVDPESALKQGNANIKTEIVVWDDGKFTEGVIDGQNVFKVSKGNFLLSEDAHDAASTENKVTVFSNDVSGWKVSEITDGAGNPITWLSIALLEQTGAMNQSKDISLLLTANGTVARVGYVHFSAGHLKYKLKVTQKEFNARLSIDKNLFDDPEGFGIGTGAYYSNKIDSLFNITSNTSWTIVSSHPGVLSVDKDSGTGDSEIKVVLQPSPLYGPKDDYTLTITGVDATPVVITVKQFGMDIYVDNDKGTANRAMSDANFIAACKAHTPMFDGGNGKLSIAEALSASYLTIYRKSIASLKGLEYFRSIESLICYENQLQTLDVRPHKKLRTLTCMLNQLSELDVSKNTALMTLECGQNQLTELDVTQNTLLKSLSCPINQLTELDVSNNMELSNLWCSDNQISVLDVANHADLENLACSYNQISVLDVSNLTKLAYLICDVNQISVLNLTRLRDLISLRSNRNPLTSFDISNNLKLVHLYCENNNITTTLDLSKHTELRFLFCGNNQLTTLDVNTLADLEEFSCSNAQISELDVTNNTKLTLLQCGSNQLSTLNLTNNTALTGLKCDRNQLTTLDLTGITNLTFLECGANQLTTIDVTKNTALTRLYCYQNQLTTLDLTGITKLTELFFGQNHLTTIDVINNTALTWLSCENNPLLTSLDLSKNRALLSVYAIPSNIATVYVWWVGGGAAGKPTDWTFPAGFNNYVYKP